MIEPTERTSCQERREVLGIEGFDVKFRKTQKKEKKEVDRQE